MTLLFIFLLALGPIGWIILLIMTIASGSSGSGGYSGGGSGGSAKYVNVTEDIVSDWLHENSVLGGAMMNGFVEVSSSGKNVYVTCSDSTYRSLAETAVEKGERKKGIRAANIVFIG